ncbi:hypothetical protein B7Y94_00185 [Candidatus Saccharibacteria bacterium 32-49-12]|nr:MAG: hypothetical protein B7Y94_00185 [Candidatus Saccharibacteria bacterium 32-49-12]
MAFLTTAGLSPNVSAQAAADWKGDTIIYDGKQFFPTLREQIEPSNIVPNNAQLYLSMDAPSTTGGNRQAYIIYFGSNVDPPQETSAEYVTYDVERNGDLANPSAPTTIPLTPAGSGSNIASSCDISGGMGWFICPITVMIANAMDWVFDAISGFVAVQPVTVNDTTTPLYIAWNVVRSVANLAFIVVFLIIIYSQLTGLGVTNYGIKKLLPRMIIGAVLVNLSFFISSILVDISNIFGFELQKLLINIREGTFVITDQTYPASTQNTWADITTVILSGGAISAGIIGISTATAGGIASAVYLLLPLMMALLLTILFVLIVLVARQALIIILIIIAPLAFVANLLPNTEKWFEKWKDIFTTMLIFFPAFSLVFGGSQLAGGIIIQNAGQSNIIMMLFGMAVQVAPLVITPLLIKLSGGLLGRLAGMINDPRRGLLDRTKNFSKERANMHRNKSLANPSNKNPFRAIARSSYERKRNVEKATKLYEQQAETHYMDKNKAFRALHESEHDAGLDRNIVDAQLDLSWNRELRGSPTRLRKEMAGRTLNLESSDEKERLNRIAEGLKAGQDLSSGANLGDLAVRNQEAVRNMSLASVSADSAKRVQQRNLAKAMMDNTETIDGMNLRSWAGAVDPDNGAESALTIAMSLHQEAEAKLIKERDMLNKHFKLSGAEYEKLAHGARLEITRDGMTHTFDSVTDKYLRSAAIDAHSKITTPDQLQALFLSSGVGKANYEFRDQISNAIVENKLATKGVQFGGKFIDDVKAGKVGDINDIYRSGAETIAGGKIKTGELALNDGYNIELLLESAKNGARFFDTSTEKGRKAHDNFIKYRTSLLVSAHNILNDPEMRSTASQGTITSLKKVKTDLRNQVLQIRPDLADRLDQPTVIIDEDEE